MKKFILLSIALFVFSFTSFAQTWTPPEHGKTRIGVIGNVWQPVGVIVNHNFGPVGLYATAKTELELHPNFNFVQNNFTAGISVEIFTKAAKSEWSDLLLGISYTTDPINNRRNHCYTWGGEALLMLPFTDRNFRVLVGWSSNSVNWSEGLTAGFAYQF